MFNYVFDEDGVYIRNLSNSAEHHGIGQYRFPHNYELVGSGYTIYEGDRKHHLSFIRKDYMELDGKGCEYEALKIAAKIYFVRLGFNVAVVDLEQSSITLIVGETYFYGKIGSPASSGFSEKSAHSDARDEMAGTAVAWVLGCQRYVVHEFLEDGKCRVRWSPKEEEMNDHPYCATKIKEPMYLVDIKGTAPYYVCAPVLTNRFIALQDYDRMLTVGCVMGGGMIPTMISGYARFLGEESITDTPSWITT